MKRPPPSVPYSYRKTIEAEIGPPSLRLRRNAMNEKPKKPVQEIKKPAVDPKKPAPKDTKDFGKKK